jgi:hypothetical protein
LIAGLCPAQICFDARFPLLYCSITASGSANSLISEYIGMAGQRTIKGNSMFYRFLAALLSIHSINLLTVSLTI